jgi:hypothetical protein
LSVRPAAGLRLILDVERSDPAIFYGGALVLSRPDQHVAWRGDRLPVIAGADRSHPRRCELARTGIEGQPWTGV